MEKKTFVDFWRSLDAVEKNNLRILIAKNVDCAITTIDSYGCGKRVPNAFKQKKMVAVIKRNYQVEVSF